MSRTSDPEGDKEKDTDFYFQYYANLQSQANMLADTARTETYRRAIMGNAKVAFEGKDVLDLGAGSGILSYMAAQAGAARVIAVEASSMAEKIQQLIDLSATKGINEHLQNIHVVRGKIESPATQEKVIENLAQDESAGETSENRGKVDTIVSEPIGVLLFHERMVESFLLARDLYLKPGGAMYPSSGRLWFVPFEDSALWTETDSKGNFFNQRLFGTDFSPLSETAREEAFSQPVIGPINPATLLGFPDSPRDFDFYTITQHELERFEVQMEWAVGKVGLIHGIASWFDLTFAPPAGTSTLEETDEEELIANWHALPTIEELARQQTMFEYYGTGGNALDPSELPEAPESGWTIELGTGPHSQRTHWQQARLLLPEPLAVNRGQHVHATITFTAHESRSYYIDIDIYIKSEGSDQIDERTRRQARWNLAQQTLNYSYQGDEATAAQSWKAATSAYS